MIYILLALEESIFSVRPRMNVFVSNKDKDARLRGGFHICETNILIFELIRS